MKRKIIIRIIRKKKSGFYGPIIKEPAA